MKPGLIKGALLLRRNLLVLFISYIVLGMILSRLPDSVRIDNSLAYYGMFWLPIATYAGFTAQSLLSKSFRDSHDRKEMINGIRRSAEECRINARNLGRKLEPKAQLRLNNMLRESDEIVQSFLGGDKNYLKVRVVQQSLKLTASYIKLADMFRVRASASNNERISQLARRINANTSNLNSVRDVGIASELKRVIEADEMMIESLKNERLELDKIDARLQYMESTIGMLKYNIISNLESDDILNNLETDVFEAGALNEVLNERFGERREDRRLRL